MNKLKLAAVLVLASNLLIAQELVSFNLVKFSFPDKKESSLIIVQDDRFLAGLTDMDRSLRLKTTADVSLDEYKNFLRRQTLDWNEGEKKTMTGIIQNIKPLFVKYRLSFPAEMTLIKTTGKEEGNAAYCRFQNIIVFPAGYLSFSQDELQDVLVHELFHIFSKNNLAAQESLYGIIGFYKTNPLTTVQKQVQSLLISNPDGCLNNYYFKTTVDKIPYNVMPVLVATSKYDAGMGGEFFEYFALQFLAVSVEPDKTVPVIDGNRYAVFPISKIANYFEMVGDNTEYIIHPEEILADNFVLMVNGRRDVKTPKVLDAIGAVLKK